MSMLLGAGALVGAGVAGAAAGLASVPHCAAMCGPLAAYACRGGGARRHGGYLAGRALGYGLAGFAAGTAGAAITDLFRAPVAQAVLSWTLALGLGLGAWRLWRAGAPRPARGLVALGRSSPRRARVPPALFGLATTLLPCGALLAALLIAAGTGSGAAGSAAMLAFAVASSLGLLGAGLLGERLQALGRQRLEARRVLAVALAFGALVLALRPADALRGQPDTCHGLSTPTRNSVPGFSGPPAAGRAPTSSNGLRPVLRRRGPHPATGSSTEARNGVPSGATRLSHAAELAPTPGASG